MDKQGELRAKALEDLQHSGVLMINGHFDYGNGYHGRVYLNPHRIFRRPSLIRPQPGRTSADSPGKVGWRAGGAGRVDAVHP